MNVSLSFELSAKGLPKEIDSRLRGAIAANCGVPQDAVLSWQIRRRSIDARKKPNVRLLYTVTAMLKDGIVPKRNVETNVPPEEEYHLPDNENHLHNPLIVGAGPAGLFAALVLAEAGADPVILERGKDVAGRKSDIDSFFRTRRLDPESNLLYGEGGAGTWSDGKLFTRVRDPRVPYILDEMIRSGAPEEIAYYAHPHIGSDRLPSVIAELRERILALGGKFLWDSEVTGITVKDSSFDSVILRSGEKISAPACLAAPGHSAREFLLELSRIANFEMKTFQIGCRIEHPQRLINLLQFGTEETLPACGSAEYLYSSRGWPEKHIAGATTFCMCPGGEILPVTAKEGTLSTNGMSNSARDGASANSAVITGIEPGTFRTPAEAFAFLDAMEKRLFECGGKDYSCPAQRAKHFLFREKGPLPRRDHSYRLGVVPARIDPLLPGSVYDSLSCALRHFEKIAPGFVREGVLTGTETHVSSPVRFTRDPETLESSVGKLYIAGEGGGMAGGIVSAALDGIRLAEKMLMKKGNP